MASEPVDVVKTAYAAFANGEIPTVLGLIAPDAEWIESEAQGIPQRGTHIGPAAVAQNVFMLVPEYWSTFALIPQNYHHDGESVTVTGRVQATAKKTGRSMDAPFAHVFTVRDGKIVRLTNHHDTALWVEALGAAG